MFSTVQKPNILQSLTCQHHSFTMLIWVFFNGVKTSQKTPFFKGKMLIFITGLPIFRLTQVSTTTWPWGHREDFWSPAAQAVASGCPQPFSAFCCALVMWKVPNLVMTNSSPWKITIFKRFLLTTKTKYGYSLGFIPSINGYPLVMTNSSPWYRWP